MVYHIFEAKDGTLWFGTTEGVYRFDGKTFVNFTKNGCPPLMRGSPVDGGPNIWRRHRLHLYVHGRATAVVVPNDTGNSGEF